MAHLFDLPAEETRSVQLNNCHSMKDIRYLPESSPPKIRFSYQSSLKSSNIYSHQGWTPSAPQNHRHSFENRFSNSYK